MQVSSQIICTLNFEDKAVSLSPRLAVHLKPRAEQRSESEINRFRERITGVLSDIYLIKDQCMRYRLQLSKHFNSETTSLLDKASLDE